MEHDGMIGERWMWAEGKPRKIIFWTRIFSAGNYFFLFLLELNGYSSNPSSSKLFFGVGFPQISSCEK